VYLLLKDLEKPSLEVTVRIRLKGLGVVLENIPDFVSTKPIVLQPGIPQILSGAQLSDNFSADNLVAQGISIEDLYQGTNLPAGFYQWEVTAYLPDQRQVSNMGVTLMTVLGHNLQRLPILPTMRYCLIQVFRVSILRGCPTAIIL
jgi:hypothetical protein